MALYEVTRTDEVQPGEFDTAYVIAGGTVKARELITKFSHSGVRRDGKNLKATKIDVGKMSMVLNVYYDERTYA